MTLKSWVRRRMGGDIAKPGLTSSRGSVSSVDPVPSVERSELQGLH
jgi:hypothetical protein